MTVDVSFPSSSDQPYEVTVKTASVDLELVETQGENESEYDRFEDLASKLVEVPKSELDAKPAKS